MAPAPRAASMATSSSGSRLRVGTGRSYPGRAYDASMPDATTVRNRWILAAVILSAGIVFLDGTIVNVALPRIGEELPATYVGTLEGQAYVTSGYLAVLSAMLIIAGAMADRYGRRRIFIIGLVSF